jgi:hypothetical protein
LAEGDEPLSDCYSFAEANPAGAQGSLQTGEFSRVVEELNAIFPDLTSLSRTINVAAATFIVRAFAAGTPGNPAHPPNSRVALSPLAMFLFPYAKDPLHASRFSRFRLLGAGRACLPL